MSRDGLFGAVGVDGDLASVRRGVFASGSSESLSSASQAAPRASTVSFSAPQHRRKVLFPGVDFAGCGSESASEVCPPEERRVVILRYVIWITCDP